MKIEELSYMPRFEEPVKKLCYFICVATHTAMAVISEISEFTRFPDAKSFSAHLWSCSRQTLKLG